MSSILILKGVIVKKRLGYVLLKVNNSYPYQVTFTMSLKCCSYIMILINTIFLYFRLVDQSNLASSSEFSREYGERQNQMEGLVGSHIDSQTKFCDSLRVGF